MSQTAGRSYVDPERFRRLRMYPCDGESATQFHNWRRYVDKDRITLNEVWSPFSQFDGFGEGENLVRVYRFNREKYSPS